MARTDTLPHFLTDVADAIREKKGTSETIQASDFDTEIENLPDVGEQNIVLGETIGYGRKFYEGITELKNIDFSGITNMFQLFSGLSNLKTVPTIDTTGVSNMPNMFQGCSSLKTIPLLNTSSVDNMSSMFAYCYSLEDIPIFDTSNVTNFYNMFNSCGKLTDTSLNNILEMCINATSYTGTKTLARLGLTSNNYPISKIESLPSYQDFINAGWTIGY